MRAAKRSENLFTMDLEVSYLIQFNEAPGSKCVGLKDALVRAEPSPNK
jgi:hypothetical protein